MIRIMVGTPEETRREMRHINAEEKKHGRAVQYVAMQEGNGVQVMLVKTVAAENSDSTAGSDSRSSTFTTTEGRTTFNPSTVSDAGRSSSAGAMESRT